MDYATRDSFLLEGKSVVILGFSSQIARALAAMLKRQGCRVRGLSRHVVNDSCVPVHVLDSSTMTCTPTLGDADAIISLAPLPTVNIALSLCAQLNCKRLIAFGTTGIFSKAQSPSPEERQVVQDQLAAEHELEKTAATMGIHWTLFRPTMIYGVNADQNVAFIRSMFRRFRCFPIPIGARGVRQPVHLEDLAAACVSVLGNPLTYGRAYNLGGGEVLLYEEMVRRIRLADGHVPRVLPIPLFLYHQLVRLARTLPGLGYLREEMVDRMYADLVTDNTDAGHDFGFSPRPFDPPGMMRSGHARPSMGV